MKIINVTTYTSSAKKKDNNKTYYWNGFSELEYSINEYIRSHKYEIRDAYLSFIENIETKRSEKLSIKNIFYNNKFHNFWHMSSIYEKSNNKSKSISDCIKLIAFERIINFEKPGFIIIYSDNISIAKSIKELCIRKNIRFKINYKLTNFFNIEIFSLIPNLFKIILFILKYFISCFNLNKKPDFIPLKNSVAIFSYFLNFKIIKNDNYKLFISDFWSNMPNLLLKNDKKINWLHLSVDNKAKNNFNSLINNNKEINNDKLQHLLIDNYISFNIFFRSLYTFIVISTKTMLMLNIKDLFNMDKSDINFFFLLKKDWIKSTRGSNLFFSIIISKIFDEILSKLPHQKIGLYLKENQAWEMALLGSWRKYNHGKIIGIDNTSGYLRYWDMRFYKSKKFFNNRKNNLIDCDLTGVNGIKSRDLLIASGYPKERIVEIEALRYNHLTEYIGDKSNVSKNNKFLLVGDYEYDTTNKLIFDFSKIISSIPDISKISFRPHPGNLKTNKILSSLSNCNINISKQTLILDIIEHDNIIIAGSSSVSLETYLMHKKTIVYLDIKNLNTSPANAIEGINFCSNQKDLLNAIIKGTSISINKNDIFWIDNNLTKWKILLKRLLSNKNLDEI